MKMNRLFKSVLTGILNLISSKKRFLSAPAMARIEKPRLYFLGLLGLLALLLIWAALEPVDKVVRVEGKIIPAGRSQQIQHLEGGIISSINTVEGAMVKRGDLLLTIDKTSVGAALEEVNIKLTGQRARAIRLEAEAQNKGTLVFPPNIAAMPVAAAERNLFAARRAKLDQEIAVHQSTISERNAAIDAAQQRRARLISERDIAHQRLELVENMVAHGAASKIEVLDARGREQQLKTEIGRAEDEIPNLKAAIQEEKARIESARAEFSSQAHNDLVANLEQIDRLHQNVTGDADRLKRLEIRAPVDGLINRIAVNTVGGVVRAGENLIELIPKTDTVLIEAKASPRDRGSLHIGLDSEIRVSAFDASELGLLKGVLTEVGANSIQESQNEAYYLVSILVRTIPGSYAGHELIPGMTVTADIVTGRRTVLDYLLSPVRKFTHNMFRDPR